MERCDYMSEELKNILEAMPHISEMVQDFVEKLGKI